jgi:acyl-coenzyme A synthetase/AMP-(fatty) acid ligase
MRNQKHTFRSPEGSNNIESHLSENRVFKPDDAYSKNAYISSFEQYQDLYRKSVRNPEEFWSRQASELLLWRKKWKSVLEWKEPFARWFVGGKLYVSENCLDRHLSGPRRNKAAVIWEGEPGDKKTLTYHQLHREVCKFANVLKRKHVKMGDRIGGGRCPIVDTWWQTETGSIMITPLPGATPLKPGSATLPFFGIDAAVVDDRGTEVPPNVGGKLVIRKPWPSMLRTIWGDEKRYRKQYWSEFKGMYLTGDGARRDKDGYFWIIGRIDDVLNVAGQRLGTSEIESALVSHPDVAEVAVVGRPDEMKGQAVVAFVTLKQHKKPTPELRDTLREHVAAVISAIAKPDDVRFADALPKTRSGKIMRRLLKEVASSGRVTGDITTLEDCGVLAKLNGREA